MILTRFVPGRISNLEYLCCAAACTFVARSESLHKARARQVEPEGSDSNNAGRKKWGKRRAIGQHGICFAVRLA